MPTEEEVLKIGKKLEKMIASKTTDHSSAADLLKALQDIPMNLEALQKTRIGMTVNNFRKTTTNEEVINLSKSLIKSWKKLLPDSNSKSETKKESKNNERTEEKMDDKNGSPEEEESKDGEPGKSDQRRASVTAPDTSDPIRLKCRELLCAALKSDDSSFQMVDAVDLAALIEQNIFEDFKNTDSKYKNRVRSRVANLKDTKNPSLKENVLSGLIPADRIARMTAEEMASDSMKDLRAKYTKEGINDHQMAKTGGTVTDLFKCGKCGKKNCTYNQVQTRSADEPMTTFVLCNECGNRWKFC